jgi:hypothetical protein
MTPPSATASALQRLAAALERENAALAALDLGAVGELVAEKEAALAALAAAPPSSPALAEAVRAAAALAARNRSLLERALAVQAQVIALVARAAPPGPAGAGYRASGRRPSPDRPPARTLCARA